MAKGNKRKVYISKLILLQVMVKFEGERGGRKKVYTEGNFFDKLLFSQDFTPAMISASFSCELLQRLGRTCMPPFEKKMKV